MDATTGVSLQIAQSRNEIALSSIKQNADASAQIANVLDSAASSVPGSPVRGVNVNISA
jgi:hypothetical protein